MPPGEGGAAPRGGPERRASRGLRHAWAALRGAFGRGAGAADGVAYWEERARRYGARAVLHLGHPASEAEAVTRAQRERLLPLLAARLRGDERLALDFGCGPGRFTPELARRVGRAVGVDPVAALLDLAPAGVGVSYRLLRGGRIPLGDAQADVAWVCLVLGGLSDAELAPAAAELSRVLAPTGLLFLVENTSPLPDAPHWRYRPVDAYRALFGSFALEHADDYDDRGERISVLVGRRAEGR